MEDISRHLEEGASPFAAALQGAKEIGFTVFSISISLIAVFIPILLMGGIVGRLFREFAIVLSTAILISMIVSLTTTPMMCAYLLKDERNRRHGWLYRGSEAGFNGMLSIYRGSLRWALRHEYLMLLILVLTIALNVALIVRIPKGFFPQQDTGAIVGGVQGAQDASFPTDGFLNPATGRRGAGRPRRRQRGRIHGRYRSLERRLHLYCIEAARGPRSYRARYHQPAAATDEPPAGRVGIPAGVAGLANRRPAEQCAVSIHDSVGQREGPVAMGPGSAGADEDAAGTAGREFRPAEQRPRTISDLRPRHRCEARHHTAVAERVVVQRFRPIAGLDHLHRVESILRSAGGRTGILAKPGGPAIHLPADIEQRRHSVERRHQGGGRDHTSHGESHQLVPVRHHLVQPRAWICFERCGAGDRRDARSSGHAFDGSGASSPARCRRISSRSAASLT